LIEVTGDDTAEGKVFAGAKGNIVNVILPPGRETGTQ
jgi:hypothetical protein